MTDYTKTTDFAAKDNLAAGSADKIVKGSEFDVEFNNIQTANNTKFDSTTSSPTLALASNTTNGYYVSSTSFGFEVSNGGVGGNTINIKNNGANVLSHNQVQDTLVIGSKVDKINIGVTPSVSTELIEITDSATTPTIKVTSTSGSSKTPSIVLVGSSTTTVKNDPSNGTQILNSTGSNEISLRSSGEIYLNSTGTKNYIECDVELKTKAVNAVDDISITKSTTQPKLTISSTDGTDSASPRIDLTGAGSTCTISLAGTALGGLDLKGSSTYAIRVKSSTLNVGTLPTSASGLVAGDIYNDSGTLKVVT